MSQWAEARKIKGLFPMQTVVKPQLPPPLPTAARLPRQQFLSPLLLIQRPQRSSSFAKVVKRHCTLGMKRQGNLVTAQNAAPTLEFLVNQSQRLILYAMVVKKY